MEDVLAVYQRPYDPHFPQVCLDEISAQLLADTRLPHPPTPERAAREDYEYERNGVGNVFLCYEPLRGGCSATVTERRTRADWAQVIQDLVDVHYPTAERIVLVPDNLNTHILSSLCPAFPPEETRRLAEKLELHYTPKHGSWLNMAEIELSVPRPAGCLDQRIPGLAYLTAEVAAWETHRNTAGGRVNWRFTTADARISLKQLYPIHE